MGFVKRQTGLITLLLIIGGICTAAQGKTPSGRALVVGTKEVPPFAMKNKEGTWTGISMSSGGRLPPS